MAKFTETALRERQAELKAEIAAALAVTVPMRAERDRLSQENDRKLSEMAEALRVAEAPLFELQNEAGMLAKVLGGKMLSRTQA
jgi:hypothetical protein